MSLDDGLVQLGLVLGLGFLFILYKLNNSQIRGMWSLRNAVLAVVFLFIIVLLGLLRSI